MMNGTESRSKGSAAAGAASDAGKVKKQISYLERQYKVQSETIKEQKKAIERYAAELQVMILCMPACPTDASPSHACLLSHHQLTLFGCAVWFSGSAKGATISRESGSEAGRREHGDKKKWYACFRIPGYQTARVPLWLLQYRLAQQCAWGFAVERMFGLQRASAAYVMRCWVRIFIDAAIEEEVERRVAERLVTERQKWQTQHGSASVAAAAAAAAAAGAETKQSSPSASKSNKKSSAADKVYC